MREDVVGDDQGTGLEPLAGEREQALVVVLLGVEEDHVEDVLEPGERLERVALEEVDPVVEAGIPDVGAPRGDLLRVVLERQDVSAEMPHAGAEPDRRVPARGADLEHLTVGLRRGEREEELTRHASHLP